MRGFYVDSCIYLNLWRKEVDGAGNLLWKSALDFFEKIEERNLTIFYSGFLLKEMMFVLSVEEYLDKRELFESSSNFKKINLSEEEYNLAKKIKNENLDVSFYDVIHMLLAKKINAVLVTRDKLLMQLSKKYFVEVKRPEEIL